MGIERSSMAESEIYKRLAKLNLKEKKKGIVVEIGDEEINDYDRNHENSVACKVLTGRTVVQEVFCTVMPKIWNTGEAVKIDRAGKGLFLCTFSTKREKLRITRGGPWIFDKALLLLEDLQASSRISDLEFRYAPF